jgi:hypothetical protein
MFVKIISEIFGGHSDAELQKEAADRAGHVLRNLLS